MAAVYTLGKSEGTIVRNNLIHHIHAYSYGGWGLYPDEGSSDILMENNLVYRTKTGGFHQHYGKNNTIRNNIFAFAIQYQLQCTRVEEHRSFNFENNIVIFNEGVVLRGAWDKIDIGMKNNLYWNTGGSDYDFAGKNFNEWQKTGHDKNSIIADPFFNDPENFDFRFKNYQNIKRIGFKPFDYTKTGVYGEQAWIEKAKLSEDVLKAFDKEVKLNIATF
jgi:parallel beta-helix repeat protein